MSDGCDECVLIPVFLVIAFSLTIIASPGLLLYGFFSIQWLIEDPSRNTSKNTSYIDDDNTRYRATTQSASEKVYHGLYRKCSREGCTDEVLDVTTFGLEVTSVTFQFLAILALPWLKCCFPNNKYLKYWNYCFLPFMVVAAIMSLAGGFYFQSLLNPLDKTRFTGNSQTYACIGGGCQIILACVIAYIFWKHGLFCKRRPAAPNLYFASSPVSSPPQHQPPPEPRVQAPSPPSRDRKARLSANFAKLELNIMRIISYEVSESSTLDTTTAAFQMRSEVEVRVSE